MVREDLKEQRSWVARCARARWIRLALVCFLVLMVGAWVGLRWVIGAEVQAVCRAAQVAYPEAGDEVEALMAFARSREHALRDRNRAVWALGQLRDERALGALRAAYTGGPCDHERRLCQYELEKAIRLCSGETPDVLRLGAR